MEIQCNLTEIPEALHHLINGKHEVQLFCTKGEVKSINVMRGIYRVYVKGEHGSGEYRYTPEEAAEITVCCV
jgi:hypothetical protein